MRHRLGLGLGALATALLTITACQIPLRSSSLLLGGDVMLYRAGEPIFSTEEVWQGISGYKLGTRTEVFAANLESPFGDSQLFPDDQDSDMNLCADKSAVTLLQQAGIDLVTITNNHADDCGFNGETATASVIENAGLLAVDSADGVVELPVGRQTIAFLTIDAYSDPRISTSLFESLSTAREESDLVVVSIHWGNEYQAGPDREQEDLAQTLVDAGADVIWGHHPHVLQRMEWIASTVDGHQALVMYSLGNLISDQVMLPDAQRSALVRIRFDNHIINRIEIIPFQMDVIEKVISPADETGKKKIIERLKVGELEQRGDEVKIRVLKSDSRQP